MSTKISRPAVKALISSWIVRSLPKIPLQDSFASFDFIHNDSDPTPDPPDSSSGQPNTHGTNVAGEIAMIKNSKCGAGVAFNSSITGTLTRFRVSEVRSKSRADRHHEKRRSCCTPDCLYIMQGFVPVRTKILSSNQIVGFPVQCESCGFSAPRSG